MNEKFAPSVESDFSFTCTNNGEIVWGGNLSIFAKHYSSRYELITAMLEELELVRNQLHGERG